MGSDRVQDLDQTKYEVENKSGQSGSSTPREHGAKQKSVVHEKEKSEVWKDQLNVFTSSSA